MWRSHLTVLCWFSSLPKFLLKKDTVKTEQYFVMQIYWTHESNKFEQKAIKAGRSTFHCFSLLTGCASSHRYPLKSRFILGYTHSRLQILSRLPWINVGVFFDRNLFIRKDLLFSLVPFLSSLCHAACFFLAVRHSF